MKTSLKSYSQFKYCVELDYDVIIPKEIRTWLLLKDSPFDASHIFYMNKGTKKHIVAFEYRNDAFYFIAYMEQLEIDWLKLPI